ncbi:hypothetical protein GINT2_002174 [Glugoides intestinalis]
MEGSNIERLKSQEENMKLEREMYRSCLKQVVAMLNTRLPPLSDSEEDIEEQPEPKKKQIVEHKKESIKESYRMRDVTPTRVMKETAKPISKKPVNQRKRVRALAIGNKSKTTREFMKKNKKKFGKK